MKLKKKRINVNLINIFFSVVWNQKWKSFNAWTEFLMREKKNNDHWNKQIKILFCIKHKLNYRTAVFRFQEPELFKLTTTPHYHIGNQLEQQQLYGFVIWSQPSEETSCFRLSIIKRKTNKILLILVSRTLLHIHSSHVDTDFLSSSVSIRHEAHFNQREFYEKCKKSNEWHETVLFFFLSVLFAVFPVLCGPWLKSTLAKVIRLFDFYHVYIITDCINKCITFLLKLRIKKISIPIVLSSSLCVCMLRSVTFSHTVCAFQD